MRREKVEVSESSTFAREREGGSEREQGEEKVDSTMKKADSKKVRQGKQREAS